MPKDVFIYDAARVPSGKKGGYYKNILCEDLAAFLINEISKKRNSLHEISELILANSVGTMGNMARYAALKSDLPQTIISSTIDLQCGGTYQALRMGHVLVSEGRKKGVLSGGMESNSLMPTRIYHRNDPRYLVNEHVSIAQFSPYEDSDLYKAALNLALKYEIDKESLTKWAIDSHSKAAEFQRSKLFRRFVLPFFQSQIEDQMLRKDLTIEKLQKLSSPELIDRTNTADYHDGAAVLLLGNSGFSSEKPLVKIVAVEIIGIGPNRSPEGCILAAEALLQRTGMTISEIDLFEVNESFACKPLAFLNHFSLTKKSVNVLGGNLAMGHPFAASGGINIINLICALKLRDKKYGLVSAGIAGGFGAAVLLENID